MDASARATDSALEAAAGLLQGTADGAIQIDLDRVVISVGGQLESLQPTRYSRFVKPALDMVGAAVLLVVTSPILLIAAIAIRLNMGNPVILRQERVGENGQVFTLYKFRTMEPDRRTRSGVPYIGEDRRKTHKSPDDPRITGLGRFLRQWSIDEIPQFVNVLKGEMSLVGPRPELVEIVATYAPWQHARHAVKPGITGPWQISERGDKPLHECTEGDLEYVRSMSAATDLKILALTPLAALGLRRGS